VANDVAGSMSSGELPALLEAFESTSQLPRDIDRLLLVGGRQVLKRDMGPDEKRAIRQEFVSALRLRLGTGDSG